jgi:hypothetical protein
MSNALRVKKTLAAAYSQPSDAAVPVGVAAAVADAAAFDVAGAGLVAAERLRRLRIGLGWGSSLLAPQPVG